MSRREFIIALVICALIVTIAIWSRVRYADRDGYDEPLRWKADEHPSLQEPGEPGK